MTHRSKPTTAGPLDQTHLNTRKETVIYAKSWLAPSTLIQRNGNRECALTNSREHASARATTSRTRETFFYFLMRCAIPNPSQANFLYRPTHRHSRDCGLSRRRRGRRGRGWRAKVFVVVGTQHDVAIVVHRSHLPSRRRRAARKRVETHGILNGKGK